MNIMQKIITAHRMNEVEREMLKVYDSADAATEMAQTPEELSQVRTWVDQKEDEYNADCDRLGWPEKKIVK